MGNRYDFSILGSPCDRKKDKCVSTWLWGRPAAPTAMSKHRPPTRHQGSAPPGCASPWPRFRGREPIDLGVPPEMRKNFFMNGCPTQFWTHRIAGQSDVKYKRTLVFHPARPRQFAVNILNLLKSRGLRHPVVPQISTDVTTR